MRATPAVPHFHLYDVSQRRVAVESLPRQAILLSPPCLDKPASPAPGLLLTCVITFQVGGAVDGPSL